MSELKKVMTETILDIIFEEVNSGISKHTANRVKEYIDTEISELKAENERLLAECHKIAEQGSELLHDNAKEIRELKGSLLNEAQKCVKYVNEIIELKRQLKKAVDWIIKESESCPVSEGCNEQYCCGDDYCRPLIEKFLKSEGK